ncbi:MAG: hypothetical protein HDT18_06885 [Oscillibacter sp.]|nr:hypothetical protein [Oscillibacter sp.]
MKRAISLIVSLVLMLALLPAPAWAASNAYGSDVWLRDTPLQEGVTYSENIFWSGSYDKPRHEYYFTYTPGIGAGLSSAWGGQSQFPDPADEQMPGWMLPEGSQTPDGGMYDDVYDEPYTDPYAGFYTGVRPVASYGDSVCGRTTVGEAAAKYESQGYRVVGAVNGDFYDTSTGYPLGILVSGGEVLSGASEYYAIGFREDGTAVMGYPHLSIVASTGTNSLKLASINKPRVSKAGVTMLTYDYRDDHTTGSSVASQGVNVLASVMGGKASIGGELYLQVTEVAEDAETRTLAENQVLLTVDAEGYTEGVAFLRSLTPGTIVTVSITSPDASWSQVTEAIGAYELLVKDGKVVEGLDAGAAPRTAAGVKANGDVIFYTIDGRQDSVSMGASKTVLAQRLIELGCVAAVNLDGGGSTTAVAAMPDAGAAKLRNSPSDKSQRKVSNHLVLLAPGGATAEPAGVYLSAAAPAVLAGHTVKLTANVTDTHYYPMNLPLEYTATIGEAADGVFTAPQQGGVATVTARYGQFFAQRNILVVENPGSMSIRASGAATANVMAGGTVQLAVSASYNHRSLEIFPEDVTWTVDSRLGTIDEHGLFTAAGQAGSGVITATRGSVKATIQVTVEANHPFSDLSGHWAEAYMGQLYQQKVLTGEYAEDGTLNAYPERSLTRAEFSVLLARYLGLNTADYAGSEVPFTDLTGVESWAGAAIRAMYSLGIVNGIDATHFAPQASLERAQAAAMLGRALKLTEETAPTQPETGTDPVPAPEPEPEPEPDLGGDDSEIPGWLLTGQSANLRQALTYLAQSAGQPLDFGSYPDADKVPEYAQMYFRILISRGALDGRDGMLQPAAAITRAEICKALVVMQGS